ncbi:unnamed protein product [Closterium sp. Naga37s-1]|nr:unnamed protein product [Closterium sp. Naga37s-1]
MHASRAGLLLFALALICASPLSSAAVQVIEAEYGDDTVKSVTHRSMLSAATSGSASVVATEVEVGATRLSFSSKRCVSVAKKAMRRNVTVWWKGSDPSSSSAGGGSGSAAGSTAGSAAGGTAKGVQCAQVKFFGKAGCKGKALDSAVNPRTAGMLLFPSSEKAISKWASVASVLCDTVDRACDVLKCEPDGTCVKDQNGERYCQWATCKAVASKGSIPIQVPYCECPQGYGMTATECVAGESPLSPHSPYSLLTRPTLSSLALLSPHSPYSLLTRPTLSSLALLSPHSPSSLLTRPTLSSLALLSPHSPYSLLTRPTLSSLALLTRPTLSSPHSPYSPLTRPTHSSLALLSSYSPYSLLTRPTLLSLALLSPYSPYSLLTRPTRSSLALITPHSPYALLTRPTHSSLALDCHQMCPM